MTNEDRKLLTEYIGECWHEPGYRVSKESPVMQCAKCKKYYHPMSGFRTFTTREDMMACYEAIWKAGEWENFHRRHILSQGFRILEGAFSAWLFCLSGSGYDAACQRVADWIKEANHA